MEDRFKFRIILKDKFTTLNGTFEGQTIFYCNSFIQTKLKTYFFGNNERLSFLNSQIEAINQCTGQRDVSGTLIYEGDFVNKLPDEDEWGVIEWDDNTSRFTIVDEVNRIVSSFDNYYGKELEVYGNIYTNFRKNKNESK